jgi:RHS repeat-associated protein
LAYGDDFSQTVTISGSDQDNKQYAGQQYDIESDSQHAQFRQYSSTQGRWMSPDPYDASYDPDNPQSFNRYSYVLDNPLMGKDASGLECESDDTSTTDESDQAGGRNSPGRDDNSGGDPYTATVVGCPAGTDDLLCSNPAPDPAPVCPDCYITPEPPSYGPAQGGGGSSGAAAAPNNATQNKQLKCAGEALKKNGVALALDAASLGVDAFGPEAQYAKLGIGLGLSTASMINSAASHDMTGTGLGMASYLKAPTELAATSAGWGWAKWIPGAGVVMDGYSAYHDVSATISDYNACMAHP